MAAGNATIYFTNGQALQIYASADAVNSWTRCSITGGPATSTSPYDFSVVSACSIKDIVCSATMVTFEVEVWANGNRTGKRIPLNATQVIGMQKRYVPRIVFRPGVQYRLIATVAQA